jgi:hypothetical protein
LPKGRRQARQRILQEQPVATMAGAIKESEADTPLSRFTSPDQE